MTTNTRKFKQQVKPTPYQEQQALLKLIKADFAAFVKYDEANHEVGISETVERLIDQLTQYYDLENLQRIYNANTQV